MRLFARLVRDAGRNAGVATVLGVGGPGPKATVDEVSGDLKVTLREVGNEVSRRRRGTRVLY